MCYYGPESSWLADNTLFFLGLGVVFLMPSHSRGLRWGLFQVFLGGLSFELLNDCLFAPTLSQDVDFVQPHAHMFLLLAALVVEDLHVRMLLASVIQFLVLNGVGHFWSLILGYIVYASHGWSILGWLAQCSFFKDSCFLWFVLALLQFTGLLPVIGSTVRYGSFSHVTCSEDALDSSRLCALAPFLLYPSGPLSESGSFTPLKLDASSSSTAGF